MAGGGRRPGAGRPKGTTKVAKALTVGEFVVKAFEQQKAAGGLIVPASTATKMIANPADLPEPILAEHFTDPADFLRAVMNCTKLDHDARKDAAKALMPYVHVKKGEGGKKDAKDEAAKSAAKGRFGAAAAPKLVASNG